MKEDSVLRLASTGLGSLGLDKVDVLYSVPIFAMTQGEVWPYFQPQAVVRQDGFQVLGSIGIRVPKFEAWWDAILEQVYTKRQVSNDCLFALFITNIRWLSDPPMFESCDIMSGELLAWLRSIVGVAGQLPNAMKGLKESVEGEPLVGGFYLESFYCHPVKVYAFRRWCERNFPEVGMALQIAEPLTRTHPYEEIFKLIRAEQ